MDRWRRFRRRGQRTVQRLQQRGCVQGLDPSGWGGLTAGCGFNPGRDKLYTTSFSNSRIVVFSDASPHTVVQTITNTDNLPESVVFDTLGALYVGHAGADGNQDIQKYDVTGTRIATFDAQRGPRGTDWIELAADQRTMFYTSEGALIRRYDVASRTQLPSFADFGTADIESFALRLLPPGDGSGGLLVAHSENVVRLDGSGNVVQTYDVAGEDLWFALNLDPDGTSFWSGGILSGRFYKIDIATGAVLVTVNSGAASGSLGGICVKGELRAADPLPPVPALGPATQTIAAATSATFTTSATDPDGDPASLICVIDFGDGSAVVPLSSCSAGATHTYSTAGTYTVRLTARDPTNQTGNATATVIVTGDGVNHPPDIINLRGLPEGVASYGLGTTTCYDREPVCIKYTIRDQDPGDTPFTTTVNWGDGSPTYLRNPIPGEDIPLLAFHQFAAAGMYTVTVVATDRRGASSTRTIPIQIVE